MLFLGFLGKKRKAEGVVGDKGMASSARTKRIRGFANVIVYIHL
jgi:hypothetical protein